MLDLFGRDALGRKGMLKIRVDGCKFALSAWDDTARKSEHAIPTQQPAQNGLIGLQFQSHPGQLLPGGPMIRRVLSHEGSLHHP